MNAVSIRPSVCTFCLRAEATGMHAGAPACEQCHRVLDPLACAEPPSSPRIRIEHRCRCGAMLDLAATEYLGEQEDGDGGFLRMYRCSNCLSSFALEPES